MGNLFSTSSRTCNYNCKVCMASGKDPNMVGRFHIINESQCKCNGCNTVFEKSMVYKPVIFDATKFFERPQIQKPNIGDTNQV